jgi:hypothetical protein
MPPVKPEKIKEFLDEWNKGLSKPIWEQTQGTYAMMQMNLGVNNVVNFNPNFGYPVVAFLNKDTKEIRIFDARRFT